MPRPEHDDEQAGGIRVERAAMADLLDAELAADGVHHVVRRRAGGLINQDGAIERGEFLHHALLISFGYGAHLPARF